MALTIESQPQEHTGAFGKNIIVASTDDNSVNRLKYNLVYDSKIVANQYAPIFAYQGEINLSEPQGIFSIDGLYSSLLPYYNNPIVDVDNFKNIDSFHHQKEITDDINEVDSNGNRTLTRKIYKAVDVKYNQATYWDSGNTENFIALTRKNDNIIRYAFKNQIIPFSYYISNPSVGNYLQLINQGGSTNLGLMNQNQNFRVSSWKAESNYEYNQLSITKSHVDLELIIDFKNYKRKKTLYFLNKFGGWEWFNFVDYEVINNVDKDQYTRYINHIGDMEVSQIINNSYQEYKLFGRQVTSDYMYYLKDLISSPVILDESGIRVRLINNNIDYDAEGLFEPEITIQYLNEKTITF